MAKRITVLLDDEVYAALLARAGSTHKISQAMNPLLRSALDLQDAEQRSVRELVMFRIAELERELAELKAQFGRQEDLP